MKCCICGHEIPLVGSWDGGNNAEPVVENGRCCNECNNAVVIPARIMEYRQAQAEKPKRDS